MPAILDRILRAGEGRVLKELTKVAEAVNSHEPNISRLSDDELREMTPKFRERLAAGETLNDVMPEAFAVVREAERQRLAVT